MRLLCMLDSLVREGAETSLAVLVKGYVRSGVSVDVAYLEYQPGLQRDFELAGARVHSLVGPGGRISATRRARSLIEHLRPDLVHTTLFESDVAGRIGARLANVPVVTSLVNDTYGPGHVHDPRLSAWKVRAAQAVDLLTGRLAVRWHAVSEYIADAMASRLWIDRARIDVVPRARDPMVLGTWSEERRSKARACIGAGPRQQVVFAAGRHEHQKGFDLLMNAFAIVRDSHPDALLAIAGREGAVTDRLRQEMGRMNLTSHVRLLGHRDDVPELMCAADLFVLSSRWEGAPGVLLEAMALDCPTIANDVPSVRAFTGGDHAVELAQAEDTKAFARTITDLLDDPVRRRAQAVAASKLFREHYTLDAAVQGMLAFYERALAS